jgi:hypothetical protein
MFFSFERCDAVAANAVIASGAKQSIAPQAEGWICFVAYASLRKRFAFVAGNDVDAVSRLFRRIQ